MAKSGERERQKKTPNVKRHFYQQTSTTNCSAEMSLWKKKYLLFRLHEKAKREVWGKILSSENSKSKTSYKYMNKQTANSIHAMWHVRVRYFRLLSIWFQFLSKYERCSDALYSRVYWKCLALQSMVSRYRNWQNSLNFSFFCKCLKIIYWDNYLNGSKCFWASSKKSMLMFLYEAKKSQVSTWIHSLNFHIYF